MSGDPRTTAVLLVGVGATLAGLGLLGLVFRDRGSHYDMFTPEPIWPAVITAAVGVSLLMLGLIA